MKKLSKTAMKNLKGGQARAPRCTVSADCPNACNAILFRGYECVMGACRLLYC